MRVGGESVDAMALHLDPSNVRSGDNEVELMTRAHTRRHG
jgi:hypothetical protein